MRKCKFLSGITLNDQLPKKYLPDEFELKEGSRKLEREETVVGQTWVWSLAFFLLTSYMTLKMLSNFPLLKTWVTSYLTGYSEN